MSALADVPGPVVPTSALQEVLGEAFGGRVEVERRWSPYQSSFALEELDVRREDGATWPLIFKDLSRQALSETARRAKPAFLHDPHREIEMYQAVLPRYQAGTAAWYAAVVDAKTDRFWLFLERVAGRALYDVGDLAVWERAAEWLATFHTRSACATQMPSCLLRYTARFYRTWHARASTFLAAKSLPRLEDRERFDLLLERYDRVVERLLSLPATLIHGEFYASNVLVQTDGDRLRVCPIDWEMAAVGPALIDLAALVAGKWTAEQRDRLVNAYRESLPVDHPWREPNLLRADLDCCRLHSAVQWLGWSPDWSPPAQHARDWLGEALGAATRLGLI